MGGYSFGVLRDACSTLKSYNHDGGLADAAPLSDLLMYVLDVDPGLLDMCSEVFFWNPIFIRSTLRNRTAQAKLTPRNCSMPHSLQQRALTRKMKRGYS